MPRDECRDFDNALQRKGMLKQTTVFNVSFHLRAIFQKSLEKSMILPAALSGRFFFDALVSLRVANAAPCRSVSHVDRGWWASFSAHFWTSGIYFYVYCGWYSNNQNHWSKS